MSARALIDYTLARRAVLADVAAGRVATADVCDAQPYLVRAARYFGEQTATACPLCRKDQVAQVSYAYGDGLGASAGSARYRNDLPGLAEKYGEISVYVVEVCPGCGWNHLMTSYLLGEGPARAPRRRAARD